MKTRSHFCLLNAVIIITLKGQFPKPFTNEVGSHSSCEGQEVQYRTAGKIEAQKAEVATTVAMRM